MRSRSCVVSHLLCSCCCIAAVSAPPQRATVLPLLFPSSRHRLAATACRTHQQRLQVACRRSAISPRQLFSCRFDRRSFERLLFLIEQAHWFYEVRVLAGEQAERANSNSVRMRASAAGSGTVLVTLLAREQSSCSAQSTPVSFCMGTSEHPSHSCVSHGACGGAGRTRLCLISDTAEPRHSVRAALRLRGALVRRNHRPDCELPA